MSGYALRLRQLMNAPVTKRETQAEKSDLTLLWERSKSPQASPEGRTRREKKTSVLTLLADTPSPSSQKKLYCPPRVEVQKEEKQKVQTFNFAYSAIAIASPEKVNIPESVEKSLTFVFKGSDMTQQTTAWNSFKNVCESARFAVVSVVNALFFFENGTVKANAMTGTAHTRLSEISDELPDVTMDKAIAFIEQWLEKERLVIYSTELFIYGTVTPITIKYSEMQSASGKMYRATLSGCIFSPIAKKLKEENPKATVNMSLLKM